MLFCSAPVHPPPLTTLLADSVKFAVLCLDIASSRICPYEKYMMELVSWTLITMDTFCFKEKNIWPLPAGSSRDTPHTPPLHSGESPWSDTRVESDEAWKASFVNPVSLHRRWQQPALLPFHSTVKGNVPKCKRMRRVGRTHRQHSEQDGFADV